MESHKASNWQNICFSETSLYLVVYQKCRVAFKIETKPTHSEWSMIRIGQYVK